MLRRHVRGRSLRENNTKGVGKPHTHTKITYLLPNHTEPPRVPLDVSPELLKVINRPGRKKGGGTEEGFGVGEKGAHGSARGGGGIGGEGGKLPF